MVDCICPDRLSVFLKYGWVYFLLQHFCGFLLSTRLLTRQRTHELQLFFTVCNPHLSSVTLGYFRKRYLKRSIWVKDLLKGIFEERIFEKEYLSQRSWERDICGNLFPSVSLSPPSSSPRTANMFILSRLEYVCIIQMLMWF